MEQSHGRDAYPGASGRPFGEVGGNLCLRPALITDLDFLVEFDLACEPHGPGNGRGDNTDHRYSVASYTTDLQKEAWVVEDRRLRRAVAMLLCCFRNRWRDQFDGSSVFLRLDDRLFPGSGVFCETCQLYVEPGYRRQGLATSLKRRLEYEAFTRGAELIYSHTCAANLPALELYRRLGYRVVRRGPLWDNAIRVSLVKNLR